MTVTYQRESFAAARDEVRALCEREWVNSVPYATNVPFEPNENQIEHFEAVGKLRIFTARRDGVLIGVVCYLVVDGSLNTKSVRRAFNLVWRICSEHRGGFAGIRLMEFAEEKLTNEGVVIMGTTIALNMATTGSAKKILEYLGHDATEMTFMKVLNHG